MGLETASTILLPPSAFSPKDRREELPCFVPPPRTSRVLAVLFCAMALQLSSAMAKAQQAQSSPLVDPEAWRNSMKTTPTPGIGCFSASYPSAVWQQVTCTTAPNVPYPPADGTQPQTVGGGGNDFVAVATSGLLSSAEGSFPSVSGLASANSYSLQLNVQPFNDPPACSGAANPSQCQGWQQFLYSQTAAQVYMQYWLLNYGNACPGGWNTYKSVDCWKNSSAIGGVVEPVANLPYVTLSGSATGGTDEADACRTG